MRLFRLISLIALTVIMGACSSDDEPRQSMSGQEIVERYNDLLFGENSRQWLIPDGDNTLYAMAEDIESARKLSISVIGDSNWSIDQRTYCLPDECGSVTVLDSDIEGIFFSMSFNVRGMKPLVLHIASADYVLNQSNRPEIPRWGIEWIYECLDCGTIFTKKKPSEEMKYGCPVCGSKNYSVLYPVYG